MPDMSHLDSISARIARETQRLENARSDKEREFRQREIDRAKKELVAEYDFLGGSVSQETNSLSDEKLLDLLR